MRCKEESQRCAAESVGNELEDECIVATTQTLHRTTIQQQRDGHDVTRICKEVLSPVHAEPDPVMREGPTDADRHRTDVTV